MPLRHLRIERFRGISELDWTVPMGPVCLLGPGDSGKTTLLDAVQLVLAGHYGTTIHDHDFFGRDVTHPIVIDATVTGMPDTLLKDTQFGFHLRGWSPDGVLHDEPEGSDCVALTVRFTVDEGLEPRWLVVTDRDTEGKPIGWRDRLRLGAARVGTWVDRDLRWVRGSALARLTGDVDDVDRALAAAHRDTRQAVRQANLSQLDRPVEHARSGAVELAAGHVSDDLHAALDTASSDAKLSLHSRDIPVTSFGQGSRRLTVLGLQLANTDQTSLLLLDELEHALEPFRLRHLIRTLRGKIVATDRPLNQLIATTHAAAAVEQFEASDLHLVRRDSTDGKTNVQRIPVALQALVRSCPEAFLARRVVVVEGSTELGLCHELDDPNAGPVDISFSHRGAVLVKGGGSEAMLRAVHFAGLGIETAVLVDNDVQLNPSPEAARQAGVALVARWTEEVSTEQRLLTDLPSAAVVELIAGLVEEFGESVTDALAEALGVGTDVFGPSLIAWMNDGENNERLRAATVSLSSTKKHRWFKHIRTGQLAGRIVRRYWSELQGTDLRTQLESVLMWATRE